MPDTRLPANSLFRQNPAANARVLVETDPRFTDHRTWLSSDYLLQQLGLDPAATHKRMGDGFYEQKLVRDQVAQLTGRRFRNAKEFADKQNISPAEAERRLSLQAAKQTDLLWNLTLRDGTDSAASDFLRGNQATFTNELGQNQKLFTTTENQFTRPEMYALDADQGFVDRNLKPSVVRTPLQGLTDKMKQSGLAVADDPLGAAKQAGAVVGAVATGLANSAVDCVGSPVNCLAGAWSSTKDGFISNGTAIGEGIAVATDPSATAMLNNIYGQDVSDTQRVITVARTVGAVVGTVGIGRMAGEAVDVAGGVARKTSFDLGEIVQKNSVSTGENEAPKFTRYLNNLTNPEIRFLMREQASGLREKLPTELQDKGNLAIANLQVPGLPDTMKAFSRFNSGEHGYVSIASESRVFEPLSVDRSGAVGTTNSFLRDVDGEYKILETAARALGENRSASGRIDLFTELKACTSCGGAIVQFRARYPNIQLNVFTGKQ